MLLAGPDGKWHALIVGPDGRRHAPIARRDERWLAPFARRDGSWPTLLANSLFFSASISNLHWVGLAKGENGLTGMKTSAVPAYLRQSGGFAELL